MIFKNCDFSWIRLLNSNLSWAIFDWSDFKNAVSVDQYWRVGEHNYQNQFKGCILDNVSFINCDLQYINFSSVKSLRWAIFIGAKFDSRLLSELQKEEIFVTEKELELSKQTKQQDIIIEEKDEALEKTSNEQSNEMLDIFSKLQKNYSFEEIVWLMVVLSFVFFIIFLWDLYIWITSVSLSTAIYYIFATISFFIIGTLYASKKRLSNNKKVNESSVEYSILEDLRLFYKKNIKYISSWNEIHFIFIILWITLFLVRINLKQAITDLSSMLCRVNPCSSVESTWHIFLPLLFISFSILWFSVHQYGRAKKLRIEQQNKQAMIHFMQAIIASDGKGSNEDRIFPQLAPFFANAIIHRPFSQDNYDPQLPIDEVKKVIDMAKLFQK